MYPNFQQYVWDNLVPYAEIALNLLRQSRLHPKLSTYTHLNVQYNNNATHMAPPGDIIISHNKPYAWPSWSPHGQPEWYLEPAMKYYSFHKVYIDKTRATPISDTMEFTPLKFPIPIMSSVDIAA